MLWMKGLIMRHAPAVILLQNGNRTTRKWPLSHVNPLLIGRSKDCDVTLSERLISRFHARICWNKNQYQVEDLNSRNGTYVNGERIKADILLHNSDEIQLGLRYKFTFVDVDETAPLMPVSEMSGLSLNRETRQVWVNNTLLIPSLSPPQYRLLELLVTANEHPVSCEQVVNTIWHDEDVEGVTDQAVYGHVRRLRSRLAHIDPDFRYILTMRGYGFRFVNRV